MKSQTSIKYLLPLLLAFMTGTGELAGQIGLGVGLCLHPDPSATCIDQQRLQPPGTAKTREKRAQRSQRRWADPQKMRDRISTVKIWKLTEYLDLSEEQAGKFFPRTREHQKEMDKIVQQQRQLYEDFQQKIDDGGIEARDVDRYVAETARLDKALIDLRTRHIQGMKDLLNDEQLARFAVFNEHFRRQIGQHLRGELPPEENPSDQGRKD